jgi:hypothetical protein
MYTQPTARKFHTRGPAVAQHRPHPTPHRQIHPRPCARALGGPKLFIDSFIANTWASKYERVAAIEAKYEEEIKALEQELDQSHLGVSGGGGGDAGLLGSAAKAKAAKAREAGGGGGPAAGGLLGTAVVPDAAAPAALVPAVMGGLEPIRLAVAAARAQASTAAAERSASGGRAGAAPVRGGFGAPAAGGPAPDGPAAGGPTRVARLSSGEEGPLLTNVALDDVDPFAAGRRQDGGGM